jgi:hypothetical protein
VGLSGVRSRHSGSRWFKTGPSIDKHIDLSSNIFNVSLLILQLSYGSNKI